jgi:hypothetical protein
VEDGSAELVAVEITVVPEPGARQHRATAVHWLSLRRAAAVLVLVAAGLATALTLAGAAGRPRHPANDLARAPGPAGVAAAYGYPLACLSITILATDHSYARADFNHASPCGRFVGFSTAIFHRATGRWHRVLEAVSYTCPVASMPIAVQTRLGVCLPPATRLSGKPPPGS